MLLHTSPVLYILMYRYTHAHDASDITFYTYISGYMYTQICACIHKVSKALMTLYTYPIIYTYPCTCSHPYMFISIHTHTYRFISIHIHTYRFEDSDDRADITSSEGCGRVDLQSCICIPCAHSRARAGQEAHSRYVLVTWNVDN